MGRAAERIEGADDQIAPDSPFDGGKLEPAFGKWPIVTQQLIDDRVSQRNLQSQGQPCAESGPAELRDQTRDEEVPGPPRISGRPSSRWRKPGRQASRARRDERWRPSIGAEPLLQPDLAKGHSGNDDQIVRLLAVGSRVPAARFRISGSGVTVVGFLSVGIRALRFAGRIFGMPCGAGAMIARR